MRNMSFMLTVRQFRARSQFVTRRLGWWDLKPGDVVMGVEKSQGQIARMGAILIVSARREKLRYLTDDVRYGNEELLKEGFQVASPSTWVEWFCSTHKGCTPETEVNRIEFEYL